MCDSAPSRCGCLQLTFRRGATPVAACTLKRERRGKRFNILVHVPLVKRPPPDSAESAGKPSVKSTARFRARPKQSLEFQHEFLRHPDIRSTELAAWLVCPLLTSAARSEWISPPSVLNPEHASFRPQLAVKPLRIAITSPHQDVKKTSPPGCHSCMAYKTMAPAMCGGRCAKYCGGYLKLPLESIVMPPGPFSFFSSLALRVPIALELHSWAAATSAFTAAGSL